MAFGSTENRGAGSTTCCLKKAGRGIGDGSSSIARCAPTVNPRASAAVTWGSTAERQCLYVPQSSMTDGAEDPADPLMNDPNWPNWHPARKTAELMRSQNFFTQLTS